MDERKKLRRILEMEFPAFGPGGPSEKEILEIFELCDAAWVHDGDPKRPHAVLTSGLCSNAFFDCLRVLKFPNLSQILASALADKIDINLPKQTEWVIGSAYADITFSYDVANFLYAVHAFTEKGPEKTMLWQRMQIPEGSVVLEIEELISTLSTVNAVRKGIAEGNGVPINLLPVVGTIIHRPPKLPVDYGGIRVVSLLEKAVWAVKPEDCPLCKAGSPRFPAKTHWAELTGKK
jgi:orotate phosphoribosyltransferase